ncbi:hypothetical protein [Tenacibaculum sp. M341]|uniref:hypothetical protein n=1 Tax=Tenacibaculum sp. M341 TaxID=2530339 RepID=UPI00104A515C|nr:hypothetical protein [Tenacibaculum sp. M341]TCI93046.1 hypothetical protein EYW44_05345 [Tenacibaculum sp. M341]
MKKKLILILIFLPLILLGQDLKCCESKKDVESFLSGIWKPNESNSEFLYNYKNGEETKTEIKVFYKYTFEKGLGHLTEMMETDSKGEYQILDDHTFVDIIKDENEFKLKFIDLSGKSTSKLKYLDDNKMILITDSKEVEFIKLTE